jgi:hypothetical protein
VKTLSKQIRQEERKLASLTRSANAHTFSLLLKAIREYPEKLRLWERALQFCRLVGHQRLDPIMEELRRRINNNVLSGSLLRARLLQILGTQIFRCAQTMVADDHIPSRRVAARDYLIAAMRHLPLQTRREEKYYERISRLVCEAAAGAAVDILRSDDNEGFLGGLHLARMRRAAANAHAVSWSHSFGDWAAISGYSVASWLWWVENESRSPMSTTPGPLWETTARYLRAKEPAAWSLWARYPEHLSPRTVNGILRAPQIPHNARGEWLMDFASNLTADQIKSAESTLVRRLLVPIPSGFVNLRQWNNHVASLTAKDPFDPRGGEWSGLHIISRILLHRSRSSFPLHWSTIFIPKAWLEVDGSVLTWERWREYVGKYDISSRNAAILRSLHSPGENLSKSESDEAFRIVRETGILLLGLLRRSYSWPASWRCPGMFADSGWVTRAMIFSAQCSSWTTAILESSLLPRQRENLYFREFGTEVPSDEDTTADSPPIYSADRMLLYVRKAIAVVQAGQLSVRDHRPRQLIPLRLEQISREEWDVEDPADDQRGDDDL